MTQKFAVAVYEYPDRPGKLYLGGELLGPFDSDQAAWQAGVSNRNELAGTQGPPDHILILDGRLQQIQAKRVAA